MIRVIVVDDQALVRAGISGILTVHGEFEVTEAPDGLTALDRLRTEPADVVLLDIRMPGIDGVETIRRIRRQVGAERPRILVLTTFEHDETVVQAIGAGADGFIGKAVEPDDLVAAVLDVYAGRAMLSTNAAGALVRHVARQPSAAPVDPELRARFDLLTAREREIVVAVARGRTTDDIAAEEHISPYTVKTHVSRAMVKVGSADRPQLVALAFQAGLVD